MLQMASKANILWNSIDVANFKLNAVLFELQSMCKKNMFKKVEWIDIK